MSVIEIRVVNLRVERCDVRIDRMTAFGNPRRILPGKTTRAEAIRSFEKYADDHPNLVESLLKACLAQEKSIVRLGCWCKPYDCHGDIWKRLLEERLS